MKLLRALGAAFVVAFWGTLLVATLASRNSSGTYSLPAGNPVVSGTTISSTTHNNTMSDIATELTNSLDRQGRGAMLAPLPLANGSTAAPGLTFGSDTDLGMCRLGANQAGLSGSLAIGPAGFTVPASLSTPYLALLNSNQFNFYQQDTRGATGNKLGRIVYDGSSVSGGTGNEPYPAWVYQSVDDTGTFTANLLRIYRGSNPASTTGFTNSIVNSALLKAWALIDTNGVGEATVLNGFNIASVSDNASAVTINIADDLASTSYAVVVTTTRGGTSEECANTSAGVATCAFSNSADGAALNPDSDDFNFSILIVGAQ